MLITTTQDSSSNAVAVSPFAGLVVTVVSASDVAAQRARTQLAAALADLATLRRDLPPETLEAMEADALQTYFARMAGLEGDGPDAFSPADWTAFAQAASERTRRNTRAAQRRALDAWRVQSLLSGRVVGVSLRDVVEDDDPDTLAVRGDLAACGLL